MVHVNSLPTEWELYTCKSLCCCNNQIFFQDQNPDISSQNVAKADKTEVNSTKGWEEVDPVSTKQGENLVKPLMCRILY